MKGRTSAMLGHLLVGFLTGVVGIFGTSVGGKGFSQGASLLPVIIALPILGLAGIMIFLGGIGYIVKKKALFNVGYYGDILLIILGVSALPGGLVILIIGFLLRRAIIPEAKSST